MIVDLHAHYPMHLLVRRASQTLRPHHDTHALMLRLRRRRLVDRLRALLLWIANRVFNYPRSGQPAVTIPNLRKGGVGVALSVIVVPYDEVGWKALHGAPPTPGSIKHVERQIRWVEKDLARKPDAAVAHNPQQLATIRAAGKIALIHAVEGGFLVGETVPTIQANVGELAELGVAYVTVAHLFFRKVATNAPALPFLKDKTYECLFPQPAKGLCDLGIAAVEAMVDEGVLVDVTHMSERAIDDTLALLGRIDPKRHVPLIATHSACSFGKLEYNISDRHIEAIAERNGVVGLIACRHYMSDGLPAPQTFDDSMDIIYCHIDRIHKLTGCYEHVALGSDLDGFIKPTLPGLETPAEFRFVEQELIKQYGQGPAQQICSDNALRVLSHWGQQGSISPTPGRGCRPSG
jgi:microsomal dipeptidase-like Zn-dependent dipeptidase